VIWGSGYYAAHRWLGPYLQREIKHKTGFYPEWKNLSFYPWGEIRIPQLIAYNTKFKGQACVSLHLWKGLSLSELEIYNSKGKTLVSSQDIEIHISLWDYLTSKLITFSGSFILQNKTYPFSGTFTPSQEKKVEIKIGKNDKENLHIQGALSPIHLSFQGSLHEKSYPFVAQKTTLKGTLFQDKNPELFHLAMKGNYGSDPFILQSDFRVQDQLYSLDFLKISDVSFPGFNLSKILITGKGDKNIWQSQLSFQVNTQGRCQYQGTYDAQHQSLVISVKGEKISPRAGYKPWEGGDLSFQGSLQTSSDQWLKDLKGALALQLKNGVFYMADIPSLLKALQGHIQPEKIKDILQSLKSQTPVPLGDFTADFVIEDQKAKTENFQVQGPHLKAQGQGSINLVSPYNLDASIQPIFTSLEWLSLPIFVKGTALQPQWQIDEMALFQKILAHQNIKPLDFLAKGLKSLLGR
jgi:hypothetical protein